MTARYKTTGTFKSYMIKSLKIDKDASKPSCNT